MTTTSYALQTSHPNAQNSEFRKERSRDLGRPAGMPLMQIRLDSSGHNYSSARFDAQTYQKANRIIQGSLGRHRVYPVVALVLIEAMQFAKPVISTHWRGIPSVVADGKSGFLVPVQQPAQVAEKLLELGRDPELRRRMGLEGRRIFEREFTLKTFHATMERELDGLFTRS